MAGRGGKIWDWEITGDGCGGGGAVGRIEEPEPAVATAAAEVGGDAAASANETGLFLARRKISLIPGVYGSLLELGFVEIVVDLYSFVCATSL